MSRTLFTAAASAVLFLAPACKPSTPPAAPAAPTAPTAPSTATHATTMTATTASAASAAPAIAPGSVTGQQAKTLVAAGAKLLDVRTPGEYAAGHVEGAVNIPFDQVANRLNEVGPASTPVVVYCEAGGRAAKAAATLEKAGYTKVYDMHSVHAWPK